VLWILVDVAIALLALTGLGLACVRLWRQTKALGSALGEAGRSVGDAAAAVPPVVRGADET
jgi:hypothetical protein